MVRRPRAGGPARQAANVSSLARRGLDAPRAFADPPKLDFLVEEGVEDRAREVRLGGRQKSRRRTRIGPNAPRAFADPPSLDFLVREGNGTGPRAAKRIHAQAGRVLGPRSGLGFAEVPPAPEDPSRSIRLASPHTPRRCPPAADRRSCGGQAVLKTQARGEPGPNEPALQSSAARRAKARMRE